MADTREGFDSSTGGAIPYPEDDNGSLWDKLTIGPHVLPGVWSVRAKSRRRIDVKSTRGQDGARFRDQGYEPAQITMVGRMNGPTDWAAMVKAGKLLTPRRRGVAMEPLQAEHPALTYLGIGNVLIQEVEAPRMGSGGVPEFTMQALEWVPRPRPKPKPDSSGIPIMSRGGLEAQRRSDAWSVPPSQSINQFDIENELAALIVYSDLNDVGAIVP